MEKDKWIEEVLNSTNKIKKVAPPEGLLDSILQAAQQGSVPARMVWIAAASIAALVALNLAIIKSGSPDKTENNSASMFYTDNQLY